MGFPAEDLTGRRFGRLTVLRRYLGPSSDIKWVCLCDCGNRTSPFRTALKKGQSQSCGCLRLELSSERAKKAKYRLTHGMAKSPEYRIWCAMRNRCENPKVDRYPSYGGRGIKVCRRWQKFENFIADIGLRPDPHFSIERRNNNGDYKPSNCHWASRDEQSDNKSTTLLLDYNGRKITVRKACEISGISKSALMRRIYLGWPIKQAIEAPLRQRTKNHIPIFDPA